MNVSPNVNLDRIEEAEFKLQFQYPKCLNEKSQESQSDYLVDELAGYLNSASASDMCALSVNPEKCAIFQETVNKICQIKLEECGSSDDLQKSEVSSSKPSLFGNDLVGPILLQALDGFLFMVNTDGKIEFVSTNVKKFLKYSQDSLIDKSIYNIIHVGDHARFSSNLLPMSIGNGFSWSEPNTSVSKSRSFNCRFLVKPPDDQEETMEEKQTRISQYEEMQISAVLLPFSGERTEADDLDTDIQNHLVCVARRVPSNEKNSAPPLVHFSTRLDLQGKITSIDNSAVPATYSQYLNKDLVGQNILELCHPDDVQKVTHHLKETLQQGSNTSGIYRLKFHQKIVQIQTKSKRYSMASEQEIIIANHTVLRDSDRCLENNVVGSQRNNPSPASGSLAPSVGSNMNGNSYTFSAMSPEFLSDMASLDFLPTSSWDLGGGEEQNIGDSANLPTSLGGPSTPASAGSINSGAQQRTQHPSGSAFSPELLSGRGSPSTRSPAQLSATGSPAPGRVTPFQNTFPFSPVSSQTVSRTSSPAPNLIKREDTSLPSGNVELSNLSPISGLIGDCQNSTNSTTQKLRNLLTHGIEEADSSVPKTSNDKIDENENGFSSRNNSDMVCSRNENIILRELLNQEDEEMRDESAKTLPCDSNCNVNLSSELCSNDSGQKRTVNNNNMLRKLLNNDENIKKTQDNLIQELLKTEGKVSGDNNSQPKVLSNYDNSVMKRKSPDTPTEDSLAKRQSNPQHAHLAGQNPMLASMLAQTPRTTPTVPTSVANAIVSQLPQERLPKNLEKKLVHTPYTGANTSGTSSASNTQYSFTNVQMGTRSLLSSHLQQEVVTADSRGHVTLAPQNNNFPPNNYLGKMLPNNFLGKIPSDTGSTDLNLQNQFQTQYLSNSHPNLQQSTNQLLFDGLTDTNTDPNNAASSSDPLLSVILDQLIDSQVYSMEEDLKMEPDLKMATSPDDMLKFLDDIPDSVTSASPQPISRDVNEKMAINAIQRQLMSFEVPGSSPVPRNNLRFQQPATMQMMPQNSVVANSYSQANQYQTGAPPAYTLSNQRTRAPGIHGVQNNINMVPSAPQINNRQVLPQYGVQTLNDLSPQMKRHYIEQRQKIFVQQQQKRLIMQQQKQQQLSLNTRQAIPDNMPNLQSPATAPFPEGMNDLLNNTVAPNVTLQRSTSLPEPQLSPRYSNVQQIPNQAAPPPSPSQLSPGQRQQPPFSPMSQQGYPNNYPQSRLSPHMPSQPGSNPAWVQRAPQNPANLQQQNPMLNAQLSQQASYGGQPRFPNQQPPQSRQIVVRSMPSPGSRNSPYSNPPDSHFHPPSPGVALYQQQNQALPQQPAQAPQQRLQRAVSIPNRVNSPRGLPAGFTGNDPILSPQPSPSNFNPPVSTYNLPMPVSTSSSFNTDNFSYEQQVYPGAMVDRNRGNGGNTMTEYVRQELRAMVGARTQQHQAHQQQMVQQMPQTPGSQSSNQSLSQADIDALGFSLDFGNEGQPSSPALFSQSLLGVAGANENQSRTSSPRFVMEEQRPTEQKKSLLQQLLSEPP